VRRALARRVLEILLVAWLAATATFVLAHLAPGDPFSAAYENPSVTPAMRARLRAQHGLDAPLGVQYVRWLSNAARGELGYSYSRHEPVTRSIARALPPTLLLLGVALVGSFGLGIALGAWQAARRGGVVDRVVGTFALALSAVPDFWLALVAMLAFAYWIPVFPTSGMISAADYDYMTTTERVVDRLRHLALPAIVLSLLAAASIARFQRAALLESLHEDYVRTARAKGLAERTVVLRHALRNALGPVLALVGLALPALAGGAVFVEKVFSWPGMGLLMIDAIGLRDYPLLLGAVLAGSVLVAAGSAVADALAAVADPRLRDAR
jgi:peptide/nickel transport system permease protein